VNLGKLFGFVLVIYAVAAFLLQPYSFRIAQDIGMPTSGGQAVIDFFLNPLVAIFTYIHFGISASLNAWFIDLFYYLWSGIIALIGILWLFV
jgi:hypothetical protein